jgi:hypothetical protein
MRRLLAAAAVYGVITALLLLPLLARFGSALPHDAGDPVLNTWILWHSGRVLPLTRAWWSGPMFYPMADSLALSELLLSLVPIAAVVQWLTHNPVAAYNAVFVLSFPLSGLAAYALARDLTGRTDAALVGGLAFMLAPYRAEQLAHVQMLSYYWTPLVLLGLHRYHRERRTRWLVLFGGAWLAQSLANGYAMFHISVLVALWVIWFMRPLRTAVPIVVAGLVAALPMLPILLTYRRVHDALHLLRDINEVKRFGVDLSDLFAAPPDLLVWGGRLLAAPPETATFPGVTLLVLAVIALLAQRTRGDTAERVHAAWQRGLIGVSAVAALVAFSAYAIGPWRLGPLRVGDFHKPFSIAVAARAGAWLSGGWMRRMWRAQSVAGFYLLATLAMLVLALGPEPRLLGRPLLYEPPYAWLMRLPGFDVLRVPARFAMPAAICEAVLVALAVARWATAARRVAIVAVMSAALLADGWVRLPVAPVPEAGPLDWHDVAAVVELPLGDPNADFAALFRSTRHDRPVVNGVSGYLPPHYLPLAQALHDGEYQALYELSANGPIGVLLDRSMPGAAAAEADMLRAGLVRRSSTDQWMTFVASRPPTPLPAVGPTIRIAVVHASLHQEDARRMLDEDLTTAWGTGFAQVGGEVVTADLGISQPVGAIVLEMGAYAFGFPRQLTVDVSEDGAAWRSVWQGGLSVQTVRAGIQVPYVVPITIELPEAAGRYVRLTQTGAEPGIPWWIATLRVNAPPTSAARSANDDGARGARAR